MQYLQTQEGRTVMKQQNETKNTLQNKNGRNDRILLIVTAALFAALVYVTTMISIPMPRGNLNFGEACVLLSGLIVGPFGAFSAAIGATLADVTSGYMHYAPATMVIKFLTAGCACFLHILFKKISGTENPFKKKETGAPAAEHKTKKNGIIAAVIAGILSEIIMVVGYYLYELLLSSSPAVALTTIPGNLTQALTGIVAAGIIYALIPEKWKARIADIRIAGKKK